MCICHLCSADYFLICCVRLCKLDIVKDCAGEQEGFLQYNTDLGMVVFQPDIADILAVNQKFAVVQFI